MSNVECFNIIFCHPNTMKKLLLFLFLLISVLVQAQSQYDYMDDDTVDGGVDRALNAFVILFLIVIVFAVIIFAFGGIAKIKYELSPQSETDRQKRAKEEREKQERIKKEQEHQKALLALPANTIRLSIKGRPHLVELAYHRIHTEMIAICLWSVDKIIWGSTDITDYVGTEEDLFNYIYANHYTSRWPGGGGLSNLVVSKYCVDIAKQTSVRTFEIELTIRGDFEPQKLQILHYSYDGLLHEHISRDIKCLEFVKYDGEVIQTHLVNGNPMCFQYEGYTSYKKVMEQFEGQ